jgi:inward rectifier potassium channel
MSQPTKGHAEPTATALKRTGSTAKSRVWGSGVVVRGLDKKWWLDVYPLLLSISWPRLIALIVASYGAINAAFGALYWLNPGGVENCRPGSFADAFYFSVQTFGTIGYGRMSPLTTFAHVVVAAESVSSMLFLAILTGLIFAKFSRPVARVAFSKVAVVTEWDGARSLIFRLANERGTQIVDAEISVTINRLETTADGGIIRRTHDLSVVRSRNPNFTFAWTVIHPLDAHSPLLGHTNESMGQSDTFISVHVTGIDEIYNQTVYARHRYDSEDVRFGHDFVGILSLTPDGRRVIDYTHFHDTEPEDPDEQGRESA